MRRAFLLTLGLAALVLAASASSTRGDEPTLEVGDRACLFLDDRFIARQSGLKRTWHAGRPQPEPAIVAENPWEKWPHFYGSGFRDPRDGIYRMYYTATNYPSINPPSSFTSYICYAESKDGRSWVKPKLGLFEHQGSKQNNIVIQFAELGNVFVDPLEKDPAARLKMFVYLMSQNPHGGVGECLLSSEDGLRWKFVGGYNKPQYADPAHANFTDSHAFLYDPLGRRYLSYVRTFVKAPIAEAKDGRRRSVGISQSAEVNRGWSPIVNVLAADEKDDAKAAPLSRDPNKPDWAELYCMHFFNYGNHYLGLLSLFFILDGVDTGGAGDVQLTWSHDGLEWHRQPERATLIGRSKAKELFPTYTSTSGPLEIGDELWLYYSEANGAHPVSPFASSISQIRAAVWRRDGFVSLDAAEPATLTTKPLRCNGGPLVLNVAATEGGSTRVALLDEAGKPLDGFSADHCEPLRGDRVHGLVRWKGNTDLSSLKDRPVRLRIELTKASLYAFRFDDIRERPLRIVCLGDSVTKAAGVKKDESFCEVVESQLFTQGKRPIVINSGVGSDTTRGGLARFERDVLAHDPTHVFIMFGLNDAYRPKEQGPLVPLDQYSANLKEMAAVLRARGIVPVLMTSNPYVAKESDEELKPYIEACRGVARDEKTPLVDVHARFSELAPYGKPRARLYTDSCHLNPEGNRVVADLILKALQPVADGK